MSDEEVSRSRTALADYGESQRASSYADALRNSTLVKALQAGDLAFFWGNAEALYDDPAKITQAPEDQSTHLLPRLGQITNSTQSELLIVSPYFVPGKAGVEYFQQMRARGVHVVVLTNSLAATDVAAVHAGYRRYRRALLESGVEIYEVKPNARRSDGDTKRGGSGLSLAGSSRASLHAKVFTFDRRALFVGSLNLDPRSTALNTEIGLVLESPELASQVAAEAMNAVAGSTYRLELVPPGPAASRRIEWVEQENGQEVRHSSEPDASVWRRFEVWLMSLLPIESQL
jgi:putative cardiolipin synthase